MTKWALLAFTTAVLIIGCGGNGGGNGGTNGGGTGTVEASINTAMLDKPGLFQVTYNTGQGRGTSEAIARIDVYDIEDQFGRIQTILNPARFLGLDAYTSQSINVNISCNTGFSTNLNTRPFDDFLLNITSVDFAGNVVVGQNGNPLINAVFPMRMEVTPGRITSMQVFLNDAMIFPDGSGGATFDQQEFIDTNFSPDENQMVAFLADYLAFDISGLANKPSMTTTSEDANYVFFSGDAIGLSEEPALDGSPFEVLVPLTPDPGALEGIVNAAPSFPPNAPGTYTLRPIDPRSLPTTSHITALQGIWRPWIDADNPSQSPILNPGDFVCLLMPQSISASTQEILLIALDGGSISRMYFGEANVATGSFAAWPIDQVDDGDASNEINGSLTSYVYRANIGSPTPADVRGGTYTITAGTVPAEFPQTGKFIVYRL